MNAATLTHEALPSLLSGVSRQPLPARLEQFLKDGTSPDDSEGALKVLSLTAQALRFKRPQTPASFSVEPTLHDDRHIVPTDLRRPIVRLVAGKT
ncbi:MAG TPA: hypothetical protein VGN16_21790, partial [Acidobacteriaceae bacterium]